MASTPKTVKVEIDWNQPEIQEALKNAERVGEEKGYDKGLKEILDWLEAAYITDQGRPDRGTVKAEAILEIARAAGRHLRSLRSGKTKRKN